MQPIVLLMAKQEKMHAQRDKPLRRDGPAIASQMECIAITKKETSLPVARITNFTTFLVPGAVQKEHMATRM